MKQSIGLVSLVVREYDEALAFYVGTLGFRWSRTQRCQNRTSAG